MFIGLWFEPWGIADKIEFKKANRGKDMMRSFDGSNHKKVQTLLKGWL
jgi:hypothetical protein